MIRLLSIISFLNFAFFSFAQDINFDYVVSEEFEVCQSSVSFEVTIKNNTGAALVSPVYEIQLPTGIIYENGSLSETTSHGVVEYDVLLSSALQFESADIPIGDSVKFEIRFFAKMEAIAFQESGGVFRNNVGVIHDGGFEYNLSGSYNILYPALNVLDMTPTSQTILSGDTTTRSFKIVNAGFGKTNTVYVTDVFTPGASLLSTDIGAISGDTIILSGSDFTGVGNGDAYLDNNESIVITETITANSCSDITSSSTIKAFWGCEGVYDYSANNYAHVSVDFQSPSLKLVSSEELNPCFGSGLASVQQLKVINTGSGIANDIVLDIYKSSGSGYDMSIFTRFDVSNISMKMGELGAPSIVSPSETFATTGDGVYACLGADPVGRFKLSVSNLSPGDTLILEWDMYSCCISSCSNDRVKGWAAEVSYSDVCDLTTYTTSTNGQGINSQLMSFFTETPTDIYNGANEDYSFIVSSFNNTLPENEYSQYQVVFTLDEGLAYEDISFRSNGVEWATGSVVYDELSNTVAAGFPVPIPFTLPKSELVLTLSGNCGESGWKTIEMDVYYNADTTCEDVCLVPLVCDLEVTTYLHCPLESCTGLEFLSYESERVNFGSPDNDLNGLADGTGELDMGKIKPNRVMVGDTIRSVALGLVNGDSWAYGKLTSSNNHGVNLDFVDATVEIYDQSTGVVHLVDGLTASSLVSGSSKSFEFDLSATSLSALNPTLSGYLYSDGDSLKVIANYEVVSSVSGLVKETTWENDFYVSSVADPSDGEKEKCDLNFARITLIGFDWRNNTGTNNTIRSCSKNITQNFGLSIGDCCSNYGGGNLFPYEYRHWGYIKEAKVVIPANYELVNTLFRQVRTRKTNSTSAQTKGSIEPDLIIGDTLYYDLEQYYLSGDMAYGDDGFNGILQIKLAPNCDVPQNLYQPVEWFFNYQKAEILGGGETGFIEGPNDNVRFLPSNLELSSPNPWVDANTREVEWNLNIRNSSVADADYTWVHIDAPDNLTINSITDVVTGDVLATSADLYLVGTINDGTTKALTIQGTITNCDTLLFDVYSGYECVGYPEDFASFECNISDMVLYVEPKPSAFQVRLFSEPLLGDVCNPLVEVGLEVSSVKIAHMYDMTIDALVPDIGKIAIQTDSSYFKYNMDNPYASIADPSLTDSLYTYSINNYEESFAMGGIPGVLDLTNNRYRLKTTLLLGEEFLQGDFVQFQINGQNACAVDLPTIYLDYDPNTKFIKDNTAGLHVYSGDNWSASWGDYNNDGFDDLFVPNKNADEPSALYQNNGDGTLTRIEEGPIVNDLGESVSSTWGDYDNDGDLDLFVANNTYAKNRLYQNNGDGTFTSVSDDPIVDLGVYSHSSSWADYDNDGNLDLVVSDIHPTNFNFLFHNNGDGSFESVTSGVINETASSAVGASWADYDNDGDQDLFIANTNGENNNLYRNDGGVFSKVESGDIVNDGGHSIGGIWGDYDNDMDLDLFVTNSRIVEQNFFYENNGDGTFTKIVSGVVLSNLGNSHGASWVDYDNDGDLDLLVANDQESKNFLFSNNGDGSFTKITNAITEEESNSYGTSWADFDNDGDYDLHISNHGATTNDFFINEKGVCNSYYGVVLNGCNSNKSGIGARIKVKATILGEAVWQMREVSAQNSALGGQNSMKTIFGLNDATIVDSIIVEWPSGLRQVLVDQTINQVVTINEDCGAKICGYVFYDENSNDIKDPDESGIPNKLLEITPGNIQVFTNNEGYFQLYVLDGDYTVELSPDSDWSQTFPSEGGTYSINVDSDISTEYCGNDFANIPTCTNPDLAVHVGATAFRRGLTNDLTVRVENEGAYDTESSIDIELKFTENVYLIDDGWDDVTTADGFRTYTYTLDSLGKLSDTTLTLVDSVALSAELNDLVSLEVLLSYDNEECDALNNEAVVYDIVVGAVDPNDKQVLVKNKGAVAQVQMGDTILYKIRFQNVGNYAARRVLISDTLSPSLDWSSIEILESSHPFTTSIVNGVITWTNNNIELPDSASNQEGSQGCVNFAVKMKEGVPPYTVVENSASIQFDYNDFIQTNTVKLSLTPYGEMENTVYIYPNPTASFVEIILPDDQDFAQFIQSVRILNAHGNKVLEENVDGYRCTLDLSNFYAGVYMVEVSTETGEVFYGRLVVL